MVQCPRCGGEMREGEAFVCATTDMTGIPALGPAPGSGRWGVPGMGIPSVATRTSEEKFLWREKTGRKKGWLRKRDEERTMKISGKRCIECGCIEFYARE